MVSQFANRGQQVFRTRVVDNGDAIQRAERQARLAARSDAHVLITGGSRAEMALVARSIHEQSNRAPHGFATLRCEGLPDLLVESGLFGHIQGSFAGAYRDKPGLLEAVAGGTVFLDEVGALSEWTQTRLLRFLETGGYVPLGSTRIHPRPNVRLISSTTLDLPARVAAGLFLDDLYVRLRAGAFVLNLAPTQR